MYSNNAKENRHQSSPHHHQQHQLVAPSLGTSSFSVVGSSSSKQAASLTGDNLQQKQVLREKGTHPSRTTKIMPHRSIITGGSLSPVSNTSSGWFSSSGPFRRDSGGSACSDRDRRGSGSSGRNSAERRDSGGSSYSSSRGRKDSEESASNTAAARLLEDCERDRRNSGSSDKSEEGGKQKKGILRQLMKWSSPAHHFKGKSKKAGKARDEKESKDKTKTAEVGNKKEEESEECLFQMSSGRFSVEGREESLSPVTSPRKDAHSRASTLTDVTNSRSDSDDGHSCCSTCSESDSDSEENGGESCDKKEGEEKPQDHFDVKGGRTGYRPNYHAYYQDLPRRVRSQSVDFVYATRELRRRRFSENHEWIRGENRREQKTLPEKVPEEDDWIPVTIYETILHEMGKYFGKNKF